MKMDTKALLVGIAVILAILFTGMAVYSEVDYMPAPAVEPVPTSISIQEWDKVHMDVTGCGYWIVFVNPDLASKYPVGYIHLCMRNGGELTQFGFMGEGVAQHSWLNFAGEWEVDPKPLPGLEGLMKDVLGKSRSEKRLI